MSQCSLRIYSFRKSDPHRILGSGPINLLVDLMIGWSNGGARRCCQEWSDLVAWSAEAPDWAVFPASAQYVACRWSSDHRRHNLPDPQWLVVRDAPAQSVCLEQDQWRARQLQPIKAWARLYLQNWRSRSCQQFQAGTTGHHRTKVWDYTGVNAGTSERQDMLAIHPTASQCSWRQTLTSHMKRIEPGVAGKSRTLSPQTRKNLQQCQLDA